jgi:hypothetical protein
LRKVFLDIFDFSTNAIICAKVIKVLHQLKYLVSNRLNLLANELSGVLLFNFHISRKIYLPKVCDICGFPPFLDSGYAHEIYLLCSTFAYYFDVIKMLRGFHMMQIRPPPSSF